MACHATHFDVSATCVRRMTASLHCPTGLAPRITERAVHRLFCNLNAAARNPGSLFPVLASFGGLRLRLIRPTGLHYLGNRPASLYSCGFQTIDRGNEMRVEAAARHSESLLSGLHCISSVRLRRENVVLQDWTPDVIGLPVHCAPYAGLIPSSSSCLATKASTSRYPFSRIIRKR